MLDPKKDPRRRCMPSTEWPTADRQAWGDATRHGDPFEEGGLAAHWREDTKRKVISAYGRWLTFLQVTGALDRNAAPTDRMTYDLLRAYVEELKAQVASVTIAGRVTDLQQALRVMIPGQRFSYLDRAQQVLAARARPSRNKRTKYVHPSNAFETAIQLLDRIECTPHRREIWRASRFRDALIIAILCSRAPRLRNLAAMTVGQHIAKAGDRYLIHFSEHETKGKRPMEATLPASLTQHVDRYLDNYRPILLAGRSSTRLWITGVGTNMTEFAIYSRVRKTTQREFGFARNPHSFRDGVPTSLAIDDPRHVRAASVILGHSDPGTTERHYNLASRIEAVREHQGNIHGLRKSLRKSKLRSRVD